MTAKDVAYIRKRDPTDYAIKDEREAEQDFLAPASVLATIWLTMRNADLVSPVDGGL